MSPMWTAYYHCLKAQEDFRVCDILNEVDRYGNAGIHETWGRDHFAKAAAALGYRLVALEPEPVTSEPGFDGRHIPTSPAQTPPDGGRWNERSTAQEGV